jgi:hypothetical protein
LWSSFQASQIVDLSSNAIQNISGIFVGSNTSSNMVEFKDTTGGEFSEALVNITTGLPTVAPGAAITYTTVSNVPQIYAVPSGCTQLIVYIWGSGAHGGGAYVTGKLPVTQASNVFIAVGGCVGAGNIWQGAGGGSAYGATYAGGGYSGIFSQNLSTLAYTPLVLAGGGGGGERSWPGGGAATWSGTAWAGGNTQRTTASVGSNGGGGGQTVGGTGGNNNALGAPGTYLQGGGYNFGGGGGGYYGGGGGYFSAGGGSSFTSNLIDASGEDGSVRLAGGRTSPFWSNNIGNGNDATSVGYSGQVVIIPIVPASAKPMKSLRFKDHIGATIFSVDGAGRLNIRGTYDSNFALDVAGPSRINGLFYGRMPVVESSGTSLTLASSNYNNYFYLTNSGFNAMTLPSATATTDSGSFWTLRNATSSHLSITVTNTLTLTSPLAIPPQNSVTLTVSGSTSNTVLLF